MAFNIIFNICFYTMDFELLFNEKKLLNVNKN
jgi:hypothetical protein